MRWVRRTAAVLVVGLAIGAAGVYALLRRSLPVTRGTISVAGLSGPIDIVRDTDGVPHIFAATKPDALFGLGYVHAQDRLWQMEFQRRIGYGRLSEIFGAVTIPQDRFLRTLSVGRAARVVWERMDERDKAQVNAYVGGVNAFLASHHGTALPPEFSLLRFEPQPWSGPDVVVWVKMMAWDLSANYAFELLRDDLVRAVGPDRMQQLMPPYAADGLSIVQPASATESTESRPQATPRSTRRADVPESGLSFAALDRALSQGDPAVREFLLGGATTEALGSNNWVVDGSLTATGKPMLANDPHLGTRLPSTWYLAHLSAGDFDVIGATLPGAPAVALGRNRFIAWGATNVAADVQDLYRERLDAAGTAAMFRGVLEPLTVVPETIQVKGAAPVHVDVRLTRHGPLISDAINANNAGIRTGPRPDPIEPLALRWTALDPDDTTLQSFLLLNDARNWDQFTAALRAFVTPSQNFVYGDVDGHIGYYAPGHIPIRASGDGSRPADGWTGDAEWTGWVPFDDLPHVHDPAEHFIVTANQRPMPAAYPYLLGLEWPEPYRATRVRELLKATPKLSVEDFVRIQRDMRSLHARALLPSLLAHAHPRDVRDTQAMALLRAWDDDAGGAHAEPAIFEAWFLRLAPTIVGDDLDPRTLEDYEGRFSYVTRFLLQTLASPDSPWCDDRRTPQHETCDDAVTAALHEAMGDLTTRLGNDMSRWRWDGVHRAVFPHQGLDAVGLLRPLLSRSMPNGGDWSTVNVGPVSVTQPYEQRSVPGFREIIDLSPANDSRFLLDVGQSGHVLSSHYADDLPDWQAVRPRPMQMDRATIERHAEGTLRLVPSTP